MRIPASFQFAVVNVSKQSLDDFIGMLRNLWQASLAYVVNGNLTFGDGTSIDNINGAWINLTAPATPNTDFTVTHNLGRVPSGYLVMQKDRACDVYTGSIPATKTQITLRATVASAVLRLFILSFLLFIGRSYGQGVPYQNIALYNAGTAVRVVPSATITVCSGSTVSIPCSPPVTTYRDQGLTQPNATLTTDVNGNFNFYISPGAYIINISGAGVQAYGYAILVPNIPGAYAGIMPNTALASGVSYSLNATAPASYSTILTSAATVSIAGVPINGNILRFQAIQDGTGGRTLTWPVNVLFPPGFVTDTAPNHYMTYEFLFDGTNWSLTNYYGSGGGASPAGNNGDLQMNSSGSFAASKVNDSGSLLSVKEDASYLGPNPYIDVRQFGVRAIGPAPPALPGTLATCNNANPTVCTVSGSGFSFFQNGDGVVVRAAGAETIAAPAAPTLTSMVVSAQTKMLRGVAAPAGSTTYCYQLVAVSVTNAINPSPETCIATGPSSLGQQTVNISSASISGNTITFATATPHQLAVGATVVVENVVGCDCNGWFVVHTVPDTSHFTVNGMSDTRSGAAATATPSTGDANWWNAIQIKATETTGNLHYAIYGRVSGGTKTFIGWMWPQNHTLIGLGDPLYLIYHDIGGATDNSGNRPDYLPSSVPAGPVNGDFLSKVASGGGTGTLTLTGAATTAVTGATILFDDAQNFLAAYNAATATSGAPAALMIPQPNRPGGQLSYFFNSTINLSTGPNGFTVLQRGWIYVNATIITEAGLQWIGQPESLSVAPGFSFNPGPIIQVGTANPAFEATYGPYFESVVFQSNGNSALHVIQDGGGIPAAATFKNVTANLQNDYNGMFFVARGNGNGYYMQNLAVLGSQVGFSTPLIESTPGIYFENVGNVNFDGSLNLTGKGIGYFNPPSGGGFINIQSMYCQGCYMPFLGIIPNTSVIGITETGEVIQDSGFNVASVVDYGDGTGAVILDSNYSGGVMYGSTRDTASGVQSSTGHTGGSFAFGISSFVNDGTFGLSYLPLAVIQASTSLTQGYSFFTTASQAVAPTCNVTSGGTIAINTWKFQYAPVYANGSLGPLSPVCTFTTTSGNQTLSFSMPVVPGAIRYHLYSGFNSGGVVEYGDVFPTSAIAGVITSTATSLPSSGNPGPPTNAGGGPAGIRSSLAWDQTHQTGLTSFTSNSTINRNVIYPDVGGYADITGFQNSVYDNFNRSGPTLGSNWQNFGNTINLTGNQIVGTVASNIGGVAWIAGLPGANTTTGAAAFPSDQWSQVTVTSNSSGGYIGAMVRNATAGGQNKSYICAGNGANIQLYNLTTLSGTTLVSGGLTGVAGDVIYLQIIGSQLSCYVDGILSVTVSDATLATGNPGVWFNGSAAQGGTADDWSAGSIHPFGQLDVESTYLYPIHTTALTVGPPAPIAGALPYGSFYATNASISSLTSGNCVQAGAGGLLTTIAGACGTSGTGLSGMTATQVPIAATATTITSSKPIQGAADTNIMGAGTVSGTSVLLCTDANGGATTSGCPSGGGLSGMTAGQVPIAATASTVTSSKSLQGTDTNIMTAGTVSGTSVPLCTSANGGATTSGCPTLSSLSYNTQSATTTTNIAATSMVASTSAMHSYLFTWTVSLTVVGAGCTGNTTVNMNAIYTDPNAGASSTVPLGTLTLANAGNGSVGFIASGTDAILAKTGTAVQYSTSSYTAGAGCTTNPTYQVSPTLVQLW